jgi:ribonuclease HI
LSQSETESYSNTPWSWIWRLKIPEKYKFFVWLACHNAVPTLSLLNHRNMATSAICNRCGDHEESFLHCVRDCRFSSIIWHKIGFNSPTFFLSSSVLDWLTEGINCHRSTTFLAGLWWIWRQRNLMCFNNETWSVYRLSIIINSTAEVISRCLHNNTSTSSPARLVRWNNDDHVCSILNVDGSCIGDPIRTGFGGVIRNYSGIYLSGFSGFINSPNDILFAELTALFQGLKMAIRLNFEDLVCYSDSLLAVNLINGDTSQFHAYAVIIQDIKDMLVSRNYSLHHTLREGNQCADFMAKLGASTDSELSVHSSPPEGLMPLLRTDELGTLFIRN